MNLSALNLEVRLSGDGSDLDHIAEICQLQFKNCLLHIIIEMVYISVLNVLHVSNFYICEVAPM